MQEIQNPKLIAAKGFLFLILLILSSGLLIVQRCTLETVFLLGLVIWSSARFYYFLFYVIQKYVDRDFNYSGICAAIRYYLKGKK